MTTEAYEIAESQMRQKHSKEKNELLSSYARSNQKYKTGDIIKGRGGARIRVETTRVGVGLSGPPAEVIYNGPKLKVGLTPYKNGEYEDIWETDVVEKLDG